MNFTDEAWHFLTRRIFGEAVPSREEMEADLTVMIRVALRTGRGRTPLVQWVRRNLPAVAPGARVGQEVDPAWAAPRLARLLCSQMPQHARVETARAGARETVAGL